MCERDFGYGCLNVFEHIEKNLKASEGNDARVEALDDFRNLLDNNLDDEHLIHDRAFCRAFFEEPEGTAAVDRPCRRAPGGVVHPRHLALHHLPAPGSDVGHAETPEPGRPPSTEPTPMPDAVP